MNEGNGSISMVHVQQPSPNYQPIPTVETRVPNVSNAEQQQEYQPKHTQLPIPRQQPHNNQTVIPAQQPNCFQVQIPPGVQQGQTFLVRAPTGQEVPVQVPSGARSGHMISVTAPPTTQYGAPPPVQQQLMDRNANGNPG